MTGQDAERDAAILQQQAAKALSSVQRHTDQRERQQVVEAEAERWYTAEHGMVPDVPPGFMTGLERWKAIGGLEDPVTASKLASDPAKRALVQVVEQEDVDKERAKVAVHLAAGGGRYPGQVTPPPRNSGTGPAPLPREWEADAKAGRLWTVSGEPVTP